MLQESKILLCVAATLIMVGSCAIIVSKMNVETPDRFAEVRANIIRKGWLVVLLGSVFGVTALIVELLK